VAAERTSKGGRGVPLGAVPIDNAEQYRLTIEALADVEIQLAAVDETLCNLPMVVRDVMRRALSDNADLLREELRAYDAVHGPIAAPVPSPPPDGA
jgi:hypothetical protein